MREVMMTKWRCVLLAGLVLASSAGFAAEPQGLTSTAPGIRGAAAGPTGPALTAPGIDDDASIYQLDSKWTNQDAETVSLSRLQGKVRVVTMLYTSCKYSCPMTIADLKRIEAGISEAKRSQIGFVVVSFDPGHDSPHVLKELAAKRELDLSRWTLLTGAADDVRELAALLGVNYRKVGKSDYSHSNVISVLDTRGVIVHQQKGLKSDPKATLLAIEKLLAK